MEGETSDKREVTQPFNIKLYPDEIKRFRRIKGEMDNVNTDRGAFIAFMDFFEDPKEVIKNDPALVQRVKDLESDNKIKDTEIVNLKAKLREAQDAANNNANAGTQLQLKIENLEAENRVLKLAIEHSPYYVGGELPPVPMYFLNKMAKLQSAKDKKARTPFWILANNFIQDLQNPLSNHLPMIVSSDELRKAQKDYEASLKKTEETKEE